MVAQGDKLSLDVTVGHDGNYWVARFPEFGLVAAHERQDLAWMRMVRMIVGQLSYAFQNDPTLSNLLVNGDKAMLAHLRGLRQAQRPFALEISADIGATYQVPSLVVG